MNSYSIFLSSDSRGLSPPDPQLALHAAGPVQHIGPHDQSQTTCRGQRSAPSQPPRRTSTPLLLEPASAVASCPLSFATAFPAPPLQERSCTCLNYPVRHFAIRRRDLQKTSATSTSRLTGLLEHTYHTTARIHFDVLRLLRRKRRSLCSRETTRVLTSQRQPGTTTWHFLLLIRIP